MGVDAARFFYLQSGLQSQMEFDVALAKKKSSDSPVFYVQYASARIGSILRKAKVKKVAATPAIFKLLEHPAEMELAKELLRLPEIVEDAAKDYQVQRLCLYAVNLATSFHKFYRDCKVIGENAELTQARLALIYTTKIVLENTLSILGITAPEKM